jgi:hypothetical protein
MPANVLVDIAGRRRSPATFVDGAQTEQADRPDQASPSLRPITSSGTPSRDISGDCSWPSALPHRVGASATEHASAVPTPDDRSATNVVVGLGRLPDVRFARSTGPLAPAGGRMRFRADNAPAAPLKNSATAEHKTTTSTRPAVRPPVGKTRPMRGLSQCGGGASNHRSPSNGFSRIAVAL